MAFHEGLTQRYESQKELNGVCRSCEMGVNIVGGEITRLVKRG